MVEKEGYGIFSVLEKGRRTLTLHINKLKSRPGGSASKDHTHTHKHTVASGLTTTNDNKLFCLRTLGRGPRHSVLGSQHNFDDSHSPYSK